MILAKLLHGVLSWCAVSFTSLKPAQLYHVFLFRQVVSVFSSQEQQQYAAASAVAEEVLSSIRTVVAFGGEQKEAER